MVFREPVTLSGFVASVAGDYGNINNNTWSVYKADSWVDMYFKRGSYAKIMNDFHTDSGVVNVPLRGNYTAKVFKLVLERNSGDGTEHILELAPTFAGKTPVLYQSIETEPADIVGTKNLPALFDGVYGYEGYYGLISHGNNLSLSIILNYGEHTATWTGLIADAGGDPADPNGQSWTIEVANTMDDLNSKTGSYQLILSDYFTSAGPAITIPFPGSYTGKIFKITLTRNDNDVTEHIAELIPLVSNVDYLP